jgi:hypothetical protein
LFNGINDKRKLSTGCVKDFETLRDQGEAKGPPIPARVSFADVPRVAMVQFPPYVAKKKETEAVFNVYIPPHFEEARGDAIAEIVEHAPLACVVAQTDMGLIANHLPLLKTPTGDLIGHVALANDMHRLMADGQDVLAVFRRDDAYVSPNFYPTKQEHHRHVPTWNYEVVHAYGTITFQHDAHAKRGSRPSDTHSRKASERRKCLADGRCTNRLHGQDARRDCCVSDRGHKDPREIKAEPEPGGQRLSGGG